MGEYADAQLAYFERINDPDHYLNYRPIKRKNVMSDTTILVLRGELHWAKILGDPVLDYDKTAKEWTFDFIPNDPKAARAELKAVGVADRLRQKEGHLDNRDYMTLKQKELRANGEANDPIAVEDIIGSAWDPESKIGNGSIADVKIAVVDFGAKRYKGVYPRSVRILEHIPYNAKSFEEVSEDDQYYAAAKAAEEAAAAKAAERERELALLSGNAGKPATDPAPSDDDLDDELPM